MMIAIDIPHPVVNRGTRTSASLNPSQPPSGPQWAPLNHAMTLSTCTVPIAPTARLPALTHIDCIMMWIGGTTIIRRTPPVEGIGRVAGLPPVTTHPIVVDTLTPQADMDYMRIIAVEPGIDITIMAIMGDMTLLVAAMLHIMIRLIMVAYTTTTLIGIMKKVWSFQLFFFSIPSCHNHNYVNSIATGKMFMVNL